uniref:Uncharacterized protein n=1 Tax=Aegilops tauschii subsp. strangulata TaxID=200361 RepID=A0A453D7P1_AEGTS
PPQPPPPSRGDRACSSAMRQRQEWVGDWVRSNDTLVRALPILVGGASLLAVLLNRAVSGIAAVSDASRSPCTSKLLSLLCACSSVLSSVFVDPQDCSSGLSLFSKQFAVEGRHTHLGALCN